jgi:hypothetical protein
MKSINKLKEKFVQSTTSVSGIASILGSWQICHNICLAFIAFLSFLGITTNFMPFLFLTKISVYIWIFAVIMLLFIIYLYFKKDCISKNLLIINIGLIIAGIPFILTKIIQIIFWSVGGLLVIIGLSYIIKQKLNKKIRCEK